MDVVGSTRLGRSSARYGPTAVFDGPVRKWKKKWVHVSPPSTVSHQNSHNGNNSSSNILLCRWTPLPTSDSDSASAADEEPPKRKFRYTPVAVLQEERKRAVKQVEDEGKTKEDSQPSDWLSSKGDKVNINKDLKQENQHSNMGHLDLGLCLKGQNGNDHNKDQGKTAGLGALWKIDQQ